MIDVRRNFAFYYISFAFSYAKGNSRGQTCDLLIQNRFEMKTRYGP